MNLSANFTNGCGWLLPLDKYIKNSLNLVAGFSHSNRYISRHVFFYRGKFRRGKLPRLISLTLTATTKMTVLLFLLNVLGTKSYPKT